METALWYGLLSVSPLILAPIIGTWWKLSKHTMAILLAFGAGTFISALAFDLFAESFHRGGALIASIGLLGGAAIFISLGQLITHRAKKGEAGGIMPLAAGIIDGIPESLTLGTAVAVAANPIALMAAIIISNIPEAFSSAENLERLGHSRKSIILSWTTVAIALLGVVLLGEALGGIPDGALAALQAIAAGAVVGVVADTMLPQAYDQGGPWVAFATAAGFLTAFLLSELV
ncbi:ZIP family metal transporter [Patescibacteria group bacterium]|nr:ZIP family metal transporter [Patescibacteria group bacterium]